jgi:ankyrin repeat protein
MNIATFLRRLSYPQLSRLAIITLIVLASSAPAFCGEIHDAAYAGDLAKVKALLKINPKLVHSIDYNVEQRPAILATFPNYEREGFTPLHYAAMNGHKDVAELLLANKADVNAREKFSGRTPLHYAAYAGHKDMVELLLANKADVNARENADWTPLHQAVLNGHKDVVELLLANKAKVNAKTNNGDTPLRLAHNRDVGELLRQHGGHE